MDFEDLEATILKGFGRDRQLITIALNEGFTPELLPSPVARRLCNTQLDGFLKAEGTHGDLVQLTTEMVDKLIQLQKQRVRRRLGPVTSILSTITEDAARLGGTEGLLGFSISPFDRLNALLSGLRRGFYYGLAGAPRRGKSNFALELATYVATNHHVPCLYHSWEQTQRALGARLLAKEP